MKRNGKSQRGVALIITLMMLAIITIVAVIFLGLARRNRAGVSLRGAETDSQFAAETAVQRAKAEVLGQIMVNSNFAGYDLTVSRGFDMPNFPGGTFRTDRPLIDPTGDRTNWNNGPLVVSVNGTTESRFFLDLNRNGNFEPSGTNFPGDPEWVYIPDKPWLSYAPNNRFIARYAYIAIPSGLALDINTIHNSVRTAPAATSTGFMRNQGVGPWEINLGAFLYEFDPNIWDYQYAPPDSSRTAFLDAFDIIRYRTNAPVKPLTLFQLFGPRAYALATNGVDDLADDDPVGGVRFGADVVPDDIDIKPYPGAPALKNYFSHQDFFDPAKSSPAFVNRLTNSLGGNPTNAYKFYDLLAQLATDTGDENRGRINLNWANLGGFEVDDLVSWDSATNKDLPLIFFTNSAQRILRGMARDFNPVTSVNAIMISPTNYYTNSVHRIMQLAANIYDSTRTNEFPTVFRPLFGNRGTTNLYIVGWTNDNNIGTLGDWLASNSNGIPLVIGAKRGLPNFNEYTFRTDTLVTRKLQLSRPNTNSLPNQTNQMYIMGFSNVIGVESWNSYSTRFPHASDIEVSNTLTITITNYAGIQAGGTFVLRSLTNIPAATWNGFEGVSRGNQRYPYGLVLPLATNLVILSNSVYHFGNNRFLPIATNLFEDSASRPIPFEVPNWNVTISNQFVYIHRVGTNIIDFAILRENSSMDLSSNLLAQVDPAMTPSTALGSVWNNARRFGPRGPTEGIRAQIDYSQRGGDSSEWRSFSAFSGDRDRAALNFRQFITGVPIAPLVVETPFNPIARVVVISTWQANDPLIHYHPADLTAYNPSSSTNPVKWAQTTLNLDPSSLTNINKAYAPWGSEGGRVSTDPNSLNYRLRDPGVSSSDYWDFPTNKLASVGWLGRIHRGTPWQTIYFKAEGPTLADWRSQANSVQNHPTNDLKLVDIFTTALTDSASRGLLSINQSRLPAWSAVLSGIVALTNTMDDDTVGSVPNRQYQPLMIEPTGGATNTPVWILWNLIQQNRTNVGGVYRDFSQLLAIPELTTQSPFLNLTPRQRQFGLDDFAYEWIPQQILGLLRIGQPRFVVYAYGQALKPERINPSTGLVENYQITAEFATRTVLRVEGEPHEPRIVVEGFNILPPD